MAEPSDVTKLLNDMHKGDSEAAAELFSKVYRELRQIAAHMMRWKRPAGTVNTPLS